MERSALTLPQRSLGLSAEPLQGAAVLTTLLRAAKGTASIPIPAQQCSLPGYLTAELGQAWHDFALCSLSLA